MSALWNVPTPGELRAWNAFVNGCVQPWRAAADLVTPWRVYQIADGRAARVLALALPDPDGSVVYDCYAHIAELGAITGERVPGVPYCELGLWPEGVPFEPPEPQDLESLARAYLECLPPEDIAAIARSSHTWEMPPGIPEIEHPVISGRPLIVVDASEPPLELAPPRPARSPNRRGSVMTIALLLAAGAGSRRG